jgi:hypothetical protein
VSTDFCEPCHRLLRELKPYKTKYNFDLYEISLTKNRSDRSFNKRPSYFLWGDLMGYEVSPTIYILNQTGFLVQRIVGYQKADSILSIISYLNMVGFLPDLVKNNPHIIDNIVIVHDTIFVEKENNAIITDLKTRIENLQVEHDEVIAVYELRNSSIHQSNQKIQLQLDVLVESIINLPKRRVTKKSAQMLIDQLKEAQKQNLDIDLTTYITMLYKFINEK